MSGFKGKPGPWHWEGKVLCNDEHIVGGDGWAFNDADKRLIAADPELLEALQKIVEMNTQYCHDKYGDSSKAESMACVRVARAAIAKALGQ